MDESVDRSHFTVWRALALTGFAAAALTAIAIFSSPSSASADETAPAPDSNGSSLLGAVTNVVGSLEQPLDAVSSVVDAVSTNVVEPVTQTVDSVVADVPVVNTVVDQTLGSTPVTDLTQNVTNAVSDTVTGVGDVVGAVGDAGAPVVPQPPVVDPGAGGGPGAGTVTTPTQPSIGPLLGAAAAAADVAASPSQTASPGSLSAFDAAYQAFLTGSDPGAATATGSAPAPAPAAPVPAGPGAPVDQVAVIPGSAGAGSSGGAASGIPVADATNDFDGIILSSTLRALASDDTLPSSPTFDSDTSPD